MLLEGRLSLGVRSGGESEAGGFPDVEAVAGADFGGDFHGEALAFLGLLDGLEVNAELVDGQYQRSGGGAGDHYFVAHFHGAVLNQEFGDTDVGEIAHAFRRIAFHASGA